MPDCMAVGCADARLQAWRPCMHGRPADGFRPGRAAGASPCVPSMRPQWQRPYQAIRLPGR